VAVCGALAAVDGKRSAPKRVEGIGPHAPDLEQALADAKSLFPSNETSSASDGGVTTVLPDGPTENLFALVSAAAEDAKDKTQQTSGKTIAVPNPYPVIGFLLGSF